MVHVPSDAEALRGKKGDEAEGLGKDLKEAMAAVGLGDRKHVVRDSRERKIWDKGRDEGTGKG